MALISLRRIMLSIHYLREFFAKQEPQWALIAHPSPLSTSVIYWTKKERYIKFGLKLRIFHSDIGKECIDI